MVKATLDKLHITKENIEEMNTVDGRLLLNTYIETYHEKGGKGIPFFAPTPNEDYIGNPLDYGFSSQAKKTPMIVGSNFAEFLSLPAKYHRNTMSEEEMVKAIETELGKENAERLIPLFKKAFPHHKTIDILTYDCCCIRPDVYQFVKERVKAGCTDTYCYLFTPVLKLNDGQTCSHSTDIAYIFHNVDMLPSTDLDGKEYQLQDEMATRLINLARYGVPMMESKAVWHPVTEEEVPTMIFDRTVEEKVDFDKELNDEMSKIKHFKLIVG